MTIRTKQGAQFVVIVLCALALKLHYSIASPDQLRWILGPTTALVELLSGSSFEFESYAGYMSSNHKFLIAASCAGVNFLITLFLMLTLRRMWPIRSRDLSWAFIARCAAYAYVLTIIANAVRIDIALRWRNLFPDWLDGAQLHRAEGIFVYFGFLLLVFVLNEMISSENAPNLVRRIPFVLFIYYAMTLGVPLITGAYRHQMIYSEHFGFVLLLPLLIVAILITLVFVMKQLAQSAFVVRNWIGQKSTRRLIDSFAQRVTRQ